MPSLPGPPWARSCTGVSLIGDEGRPIGALSGFFAEPGAQGPSVWASTVRLLGQMLGAIHACQDDAARWHGQAASARRAAQTDALPGLRNRRGWCVSLARASWRSARLDAPAGVVVVDLDELKVLNDVCGHAAGDALLRRTGLVLTEACRSTDTVARLGGDEFGVLAVDADVHALRALAVRIRHRLRAAGVAASLGASAGGDVEAVWAAADRAMYVDKASRRARRPAVSAAVGVGVPARWEDR